jgi:hypothetical protein
LWDVFVLVYPETQTRQPRSVITVLMLHVLRIKIQHAGGGAAQAQRALGDGVRGAETRPRIVPWDKSTELKDLTLL